MRSDVMMSLLQRLCHPLSHRFYQISLQTCNNLHYRSLTKCAKYSNNLLYSGTSFTRRSVPLNPLIFSNSQYPRSLCTIRNIKKPYLPLKRTGTYGSKLFWYNPACSKSTISNRSGERNKSVMLYVIACTVLVIGFSYAAVPLYTIFCQATGLGGEVQVGHDADKVESMSRVPGRQLVIKFNADTAASMRWNFKPQQTEIKVYPGETALAFYSAINPTDKPIIGISTYNVVPFDAGQYFNKIQCFCFEEQILNPHEQVDMPVFFYIDPEIAEDPKMQRVDTITLSYTFFEAKEGLVLPDPMTKPSA